MGIANAKFKIGECQVVGRQELRVGDRIRVGKDYAQIVAVTLDCQTGEMTAQMRLVRSAHIHNTIRIGWAFDFPVWVDPQGAWT